MFKSKNIKKDKILVGKTGVMFKDGTDLNKVRDEIQKNIDDLPLIGYSNDVVDYVGKANAEKSERENTFHKKKLLEMCEGWSEDEVQIACKVFARRFPDAMYGALSNEHQSMVSMVSGVNQLNVAYMEKMCGL